MKESMDVMFGSHSVNHWNLTMLDQNELVYELSNSKRMIEDKLNDKIDLLAYPGGGFNDNVIKIAKEVGYSAAFKDRIEKEMRITINSILEGLALINLIQQ